MPDYKPHRFRPNKCTNHILNCIYAVLQMFQMQEKKKEEREK
jgi:hypothetical protein